MSSQEKTPSVVEDIAKKAYDDFEAHKQAGTLTELKTWAPTRKWITAAGLGVLTIAGHVVATGSFNAAEWAEVLTLVTTLVGSYFVSNKSTPGGVPTKTVNEDAS